MNNFHLYNGNTLIDTYATLCEAIEAAELLPSLSQGYDVYDIANGTAWNGPRPKYPPQ